MKITKQFESIKPLDHGELSIPNRTKNINKELDKYKEEQAKIKKQEMADLKERNKAAKEEKQNVMDESMTEQDKKEFKKVLVSRLKEKMMKELGYSSSFALSQAKVDVNNLFENKPDLIAKAWLNEKSK